MKEYKYILEKGSKKHNCPACAKKRFVRYIDSSTSEHLPDQFGRCDREINCGYHLNPYKDEFIKHEESSKFIQPPTQSQQALKLETTFIPFEILKQTRQGWDQNTFLQNLLYRIPYPIEVKDIEGVISQYDLGTICKGYRAGSITFPFRDVKGRVRAIQVKKFNETNHTVATDFLHSIIEKYHIREKEPLPKWLIDYIKNDTKVSCLFGEHLLIKHQLNPIALVEAPKTAIYGTLYFGFPNNSKNLLWLAVYNLSSLTVEKCKVLQGRNVYLFPDLSKDGKAFQLWSNKAKELSQLIPGTLFEISDLLELNASEVHKTKGFDLADFLIKQDWRKFRREHVEKKITEHKKEVLQESNLIPSISNEIIAEAKPINSINTEPLEKEINAFLDELGKLLIPTPFANTFTVYPSTNHYNLRLCLPEFINKTEININDLVPVVINMKTLMVDI